MTNPWITRLGGIITVVLVGGSLIFLQTLNDEKSLLFGLWAYGVIAIAALIALVTLPSDYGINRGCLWTSAIFFGYIVLRALTSPAPYFARADLFCVLGGLVLYGLVSCVLVSPRRRMALILFLLGFAVVHVLFAVVQTGFGENLSMEDVERTSRATGLYINPNHLAGLLEVLGIFALSITCWSRWPKWMKVVTAYLAGICYFGVALTGSRGGYLSVAVSLTLFVILSLIVLRAGGTGLLLRFGGSGLILLVVALVTLGIFIQRSAPLRHAAEQIITDEGRSDLWQAAIEQWRLRPMTGTGSGTYLFYGREFRSERMQGDPVDVHNDYLELLSEYGLLGAGAFLLFFCTHLRRGWRAFLVFGPRRLAAGSIPLSDRLALNLAALCAIAAYVVHSAFDFNLHIPANALLLAFVFGLVANPGLQFPSEASVGSLKLGLKLAGGGLATVVLVCAVRLLPGEHYAERARVALRDEDPPGAIALANEALGHEQKNPLIFFYLGRALLATAHLDVQPAERTNFYEGALAAFEKARQLAPLDGSYPVEKAFVYDEMGRFPEAEEMFAIARVRDPRSTAIQQRYETHLESWRRTKENGTGEEAGSPRK